MSWVIGVEWDPFATAASDAANEGESAYRGEFFENTPEATPTEVWLAEMLDHLAELEAGRGVTMPMSFVNWPTTDPLIHPDEPLEREDSTTTTSNRPRRGRAATTPAITPIPTTRTFSGTRTALPGSSWTARTTTTPDT
jgi:hypothetical protein